MAILSELANAKLSKTHKNPPLNASLLLDFVPSFGAVRPFHSKIELRMRACRLSEEIQRLRLEAVGWVVPPGRSIRRPKLV